MEQKPISEERLATITDAASQLGLFFDQQQLRRDLLISGTVDARLVELGFRFERGVAVGYALAVETLARGPIPRIQFKPALPWPVSRASDRILTGDLRFDGVVAVRGPEPQVRAVLCSSVRQCLHRVFSIDRHDAVQFDSGRLLLRGTGFSLHGRDLATLVRALLEVAEQVALDQRSILDRVLENTVQDPDKRVRATNGDLLMNLIESSTDEERFSCRKMLAVSENALERHRIEALNALREHAVEDVLPVMNAVLKSASSKQLCLIAIEYLGEAGYEPSIRQMATFAGRNESSSMALGIAVALRRIGSSGAEYLLLELLQHHDDSVKCAVIKALGEVGSLMSVPALASVGKGFFKNRRLKEASAEAIAAIRDRVGDVAPGRLSVVRSESNGAVSIADGGAGALSVPED